VARLRLSAAAQADILSLLVWSAERFGDVVRTRYEALLVAALADLAAEPDRPGSMPRPELGSGIRSYHLRHSRKRVRATEGAVRRPRHLVLYRIERGGTVEVGRVLHDTMELERHALFDLPEDR
jgi:toxin ParE1/3/4